MKKLSPAPSVPRTMTVSLFQPCTTTLPTMLAMRSAPSIPNGSLRSTFFCAAAGDVQNASATAIMSSRWRDARNRKRLTVVLGATRQLRGAPQQIHLLPVTRGEHFDEHLVRWVAGECIPRLQNRFVDGPQARLELRDGLGRERCFLLIEQILQHGSGSQVVVLLGRKSCETGR